MRHISLYKTFFPEIDGEVEEINYKNNIEGPEKFSYKFETSIPTLEMLSEIMENVLLKKKSETTAYVGFQRTSRAEAVWDRYHKIANNIKKVFVFGIKDKILDPHPNIELVDLSEKHPLIREWFLVIDHPQGKSMLVAYDLDGLDKSQNEKSRNFIGFKTSNPELVNKAVRLIKNAL
ncbi:MAG: DICT sensory domain-containing protein [Bacillota bacterium]